MSPFCLAVLLCWTGGCAGRADGRPSIVLITVDTLRADHLSCYGYSRATSPHIDDFARNALRFEHCLSHASETRTSLGSLLSGFLPHETQVALEGLPLLEEVETLPETLQRVGYKTVAVVSNYVLRRAGGWAQGFAVFDDSMNEHELNRRVPERTAERTTDRAIELLEQFHKDPLFLWVHYQDPHGPYTPPDRFAQMFPTAELAPRRLPLNESLSGLGGIPRYQRLGEDGDYHHYVSRYDREIRYLDEQFGRLLAALKEHGLYDRALIVFTADHGEDMGEHGFFFSHAETVYSSSTHVPLILRHGKALQGTSRTWVQHIDLVPTVYRILGLETDPRFRGRDLRGDDAPRDIVAEVRSPLRPDGLNVSIVRDGLKLICAPSVQRYELYDLETDPREERDRIRDASLHDRAEDLIATLDRILKEDSLKLPADKGPPKLTEEEKENLKSLGYVQ